MTELEKYEAVNKCETFEDFEKVLKSFADEEGRIQGRTRTFDIYTMLAGARYYYESDGIPNAVTREYGLRQQLMYIKFYK